jgi:hypothetical protein
MLIMISILLYIYDFIPHPLQLHRLKPRLILRLYKIKVHLNSKGIDKVNTSELIECIDQWFRSVTFKHKNAIKSKMLK